MSLALIEGLWTVATGHKEELRDSVTLIYKIDFAKRKPERRSPPHLSILNLRIKLVQNRG